MVVTSSLLVGAIVFAAGAYLLTHAADEVDRWTERHGVGEQGADPASTETAIRRNRWVAAFLLVLGAALFGYGVLG